MNISVGRSYDVIVNKKAAAAKSNKHVSSSIAMNHLVNKFPFKFYQHFGDVYERRIFNVYKNRSKWVQLKSAVKLTGSNL